jgi:hypothetical protein
MSKRQALRCSRRDRSAPIRTHPPERRATGEFGALVDELERSRRRLVGGALEGRTLGGGRSARRARSGHCRVRNFSDELPYTIESQNTR